MKINYPDAIRQLRAELNISHQELAKLLGVAFSSVNRWENGHFIPISNVKCKLDELFQQTGINDQVWPPTNKKKNLILITGLPASGKTTIAKKLSSDLGWCYLGKDEFKIKYYEKYGFNNLQERKILDNKSEYDLYTELTTLLDQGENVIFDKWISGNFTLLELIARPRNINVITIYLDCDVKIAVKRFNDRIDSNSRPICLSVDKYPIEDKKRNLGYISFDEMERKFETITNKGFGDYRLEINTDNIEKDETIYKRIKSFVLNSIN